MYRSCRLGVFLVWKRWRWLVWGMDLYLWVVGAEGQQNTECGVKCRYQSLILEASCISVFDWFKNLYKVPLSGKIGYMCITQKGKPSSHKSLKTGVSYRSGLVWNTIQWSFDCPLSYSVVLSNQGYPVKWCWWFGFGNEIWLYFPCSWSRSMLSTIKGDIFLSTLLTVTNHKCTWKRLDYENLKVMKVGWGEFISWMPGCHRYRKWGHPRSLPSI